MKLAFTTPFSKNSTSGRRARLILPALSRHHEVHVWHPPEECVIDADVPVNVFESSRATGNSWLDEYDIVVYQIGNDAGLFAPILELSSQRPGIVILLDYFLRDLLQSYYLTLLREPVAFVRLMEQAYGERARRFAEDIVIGRNPAIWGTQKASEYPLFEPLLTNALGVVVHSNSYLGAVRRAYAGPSARINLAVPHPPQPTHLSRADLGIPPNRTLMVSSCSINGEGLHEAVIRALHRSPELRSRTVLAIVGGECPVEGHRLRAMVSEYGLESAVLFAGCKPDDMMHAWVDHADFCFSVGRTDSEGALLPVLELMQRGKTVVVPPGGFFDELPPDAVVRVPLEDFDNLHHLLLQLGSDQQWRARVGDRARQYVSSGFDPAQYGEHLAGFISEVQRQSPLTHLRRRVSDELLRMGHAAGEFLSLHTNREISRLFTAGDEQQRSGRGPAQDNS